MKALPKVKKVMGGFKAGKLHSGAIAHKDTTIVMKDLKRQVKERNKKGIHLSPVLKKVSTGKIK